MNSENKDNLGKSDRSVNSSGSGYKKNENMVGKASEHQPRAKETQSAETNRNKLGDQEHREEKKNPGTWKKTEEKKDEPKEYMRDKSDPKTSPKDQRV